MKWIALLSFSLLALPYISAQPNCVVPNCCCGEPVEVGIPCGGFEAPPFANPIIVVYSGQSHCNWQVINGSIDILGPNFSNWASGNPNGASQFIDLHGDTPGTITTTLFGLVPDNRYTLVFWYAKNSGASSADCRVQVAGGAWLDETFTATNNGPDGWLEKCYSFIAQSASAELRFTGQGGNPNQGVLLDDITLWGCAPDTEAPLVLNPPPAWIAHPCQDPLPPLPVLNVTDNCGLEIDIFLNVEQQNQPCLYDIIRTWTVVDMCGNSTTLSQTIEVRDTDPPFFLGAPTNYDVPCNNDIALAFESYIINQGYATALDNCDQNLTWEISYDDQPGPACGTTLVTFVVTDACGNSTEAQAIFTVYDQSPPLLLQPAADKYICQPSYTDSLLAWLDDHGGAIASDPCSPLTWSHNYDGDPTPEAITITFTATDGCGNIIETTATFTQLNNTDTLYQQSFTCNPQLAGSDTLTIDLAGCLTLSINNTILRPSDTIYLNLPTCNPQQPLQDTLRMSNQYGCDSLLITSYSLYIQDTVLQEAFSCDSNQVGTYISTLPGQPCDTLVITSINWRAADTTNLTALTCDPIQAGTDTLIYQNQNGCDSVVITSTLLTNQVTYLDTLLLCGSNPNLQDTMTISGTPCDTLRITTYIYTSPDTTWTYATTCSPNQAGTSLINLTNTLGCDSLIIQTTLLLPSDTTYQMGFVCDPLLTIQDTLVLSNQLGCDSLLIRNFTFAGPDTLFIQQTDCDSTKTGNSTFVHPGPYCDTIIIVATTWASYTFSTDTLIACELPVISSDTTWLINAAGCDSLHIRVYHYQPLEAQITAIPERCAGEANGQIQIDTPQGGVPPFRFRLNNNPWQSTPLFPNLPPGNYTLQMEDSQPCTREWTTITILPGALFSINAGPDREADYGDILPLNLQSSSPPIQIQWNGPDPLTCPTCPSTLLGPLTISQTVRVSASNEQGCTAEDDLDIRLRPRKPALYIPNSFSPNGDGINDHFRVYTNEEPIRIKQMAIYDRWGNALYFQENLVTDQADAGWDGTFRGQPMDPAVFVYVIIVTLDDQRDILYKGDITLVR